MTTTMIAYIALLIAALFDLFVMLRRDTLALQQCDFNNSAYNKHLQAIGEFTSTKRLLVIAVLIGVCTTMARMSWMVVSILAAVTLVQAIVLASKGRVKESSTSKRAIRLFATCIILSLLVVELARHLGSIKSEESATHDAAIAALIAIVISPLIVMAANWILQPIEHRINKK